MPCAQANPAGEWRTRSEPASVWPLSVRGARRLGRILFLVACIVGGVVADVRAQPVEPREAAVPVVVVRLAAEVSPTERDAIAAHLADLPIALRMADSDEPVPAGDVEIALLRIEDGWRIVRRGADERTVIDEASPTTTSEVLGVTVRAAVKDGLTRPEPAPPEPPPMTETRPRLDGRHGVRLQAMYVGSSYAPQKPWLHGFQPSVGWYAPWGLGVRVGYSVFAPIEVASPLGSIRVHRHPIELMLGWDRTEHRVGWAVELGTILDPQRRTAHASDAMVLADRMRRSIDGALAVRARVGVRGRWWEVFVGGGGELWLRPAQIVAADARTPTPVLQPARWRGQVGAGVALRW